MATANTSQEDNRDSSEMIKYITSRLGETEAYLEILSLSTLTLMTLG